METTPSQVCDDFLALLKRVKTVLIELAEKHKLTPVQVGVLYAISNGHATMGNIACTLQCDASNVTGIIDRLVAQKLVVRKESEHDRRTKILTLTMKGRRTIGRIASKLPNAIGCQHLTDVERHALHQIVVKLLAI